MVLIRLHNRGKLGFNPYLAARRYAAALMFLSDYEKSCFAERYRCALNREIGGGKKNSDGDISVLDASDRYLIASHKLKEKETFDICRTVIIEDLPPKQILGKSAGQKAYRKFYQDLNVGLDVLIAFYGV